jgi:hypothetical protein
MLPLRKRLAAIFEDDDLREKWMPQPISLGAAAAPVRFAFTRIAVSLFQPRLRIDMTVIGHIFLTIRST